MRHPHRRRADGATSWAPVKEGQLADLLLVDGDPMQDVRMLQDRARLKLIMKDGVAYKNTLAEAIAAHERHVA